MIYLSVDTSKRGTFLSPKKSIILRQKNRLFYAKKSILLRHKFTYFFLNISYKSCSNEYKLVATSPV